jgi:TDG/mug DNA glycosylase family protein
MLSDLLTPQLKVVFCGTAVGNKSAQLKQYYAKPGNKFWKALFEVGLTPVLLTPPEYEKLLDYKIGLTDLVKHKSGMDTGLNAAFNGKRAAEAFLGRKVEYGLQPEKIGDTYLFVVPSTSGAASGWWNIEVWRELAQRCDKDD